MSSKRKAQTSTATSCSQEKTEKTVKDVYVVTYLLDGIETSVLIKEACFIDANKTKFRIPKKGLTALDMTKKNFKPPQKGYEEHDVIRVNFGPSTFKNAKKLHDTLSEVENSNDDSEQDESFGKKIPPAKRHQTENADYDGNETDYNDEFTIAQQNVKIENKNDDEDDHLKDLIKEIAESTSNSNLLPAGSGNQSAQYDSILVETLNASQNLIVRRDLDQAINDLKSYILTQNKILLTAIQKLLSNRGISVQAEASVEVLESQDENLRGVFPLASEENLTKFCNDIQADAQFRKMVDDVHGVLEKKIKQINLKACHNIVRGFLITPKLVMGYNRTGTKNNVPNAKKALPNIFINFMKALYNKLPFYKENPDDHLKDFYQAWSKVTDKPKVKKEEKDSQKESE